MKKILIVDDNANNRMLLRAVLETYEEENKSVKLKIDEATNGIEAVSQAAHEAYDLILMDIMMPEMDGIEATRRIRTEDSKVIIVAVSAVDDTERQRQILHAGAEDYIAKPINVDIFTARLANYFSLCEARRNKSLNKEAYNLYSRSIFSRKLLFRIENDNDLAEFWEYYLLNSQNACALLSDAVRTLYTIGSIGLKFKLEQQIWVEESPEYTYFTLAGLTALDPKFIRLTLQKNPVLTDYMYDEDKISIRLKLENTSHKTVANHETHHENVVKSTMPEALSEGSSTVAFEITDKTENQVYAYMEEEDLGDIKAYIAKLNSLLLVVGSGDIQVDEVDEIGAYLDRIGKIASIYSESYTIGRALSTLSIDIREHIQLFIEKSSALGPLCAAFSRDLMGWIRLIFEEGAPSVNYMDDTIISNTQTIGSILTMEEHAGDAVDLDDIFDF
ncbi:MAG: response regulator [Sulfuricurvum sp.]|nr:response regulator [Sulfuricurvum sp.]